MEQLTTEQKATNFDTMLHIRKVQDFMFLLTSLMMKRALEHDESKLSYPEVDGFTEHTHKLKNLTYSSPEYQASLSDLETALAHHYAKNRHHPDHFARGLDDMNLVDLTEFIVDCCASALRQNNGNIRHSLPHMVKRFNISPQLANIIENTIGIFEK